MTKSPISQETETFLNAALRAAVLAGSDVMDVYAKPFDVELKGDDSPLTEADRRSHDRIVAVLRETSPAIPLLSEEGAEVPYDERRGWPRYWLIDPLDGTKEFVKKNDEFTVNIALVSATSDGYVPELGVVHAPAMQELFAGEAGLGAFRVTQEPDCLPPTVVGLRERGLTLPVDDSDRPYTIVASRSHMSPETEAFVDEGRTAHPGLQLISAGSSLKLCRVADGSADEYPRFAPTMEWDTAAGDAVARAAGCEVMAWAAGTGQKTGPAGSLMYNKQDLHNPWFLVRRRSLS